MKKRSLRKYEAIWLKLRDQTIETKECAKLLVRCAPQERKRIVKAVVKEKWMDESWPEKYFFRLQSESVPNGIEFRLVHHRLNQIISENL